MPRWNEERTVALMIGLYCRNLHGVERGYCSDCAALLDYSRRRLSECPQLPDKPVCANCRIHCYRPEMRERIRRVMRYSGPRMFWRHPLIALGYLARKLRRG